MAAKAAAAAAAAADRSAPGGLRKGKTIEQIYQKKSQLEHILLRPDTYVGAIEQQQDKLWVFDEARKKMVQREIRYVPGLYKIFDEILVNAADNFQRDPKNMTYIKVCINEEENFVSVENNGSTLPVEVHKQHKMYVPEMVFGHLLTSDNYDDDDEKVTGGRNGYGAKLTNIFSKSFTIECADGKRKQHYTQTWECNMSTKGKAKIKPYSGKDFTKVTFYPDLPRFGMQRLDKDIVALMKKRVMDVAGSSSHKCQVFLNDSPAPINNFKEYSELYFESEEQPKVYDRCDRWEYVISVSEGQFQQVSFVNSINTIKGGTHVAHVVDQFVDAIRTKANKANKGGINIAPFHVKSHLSVFVNALIVNPSFDSQTKETMTLKQGKFGSKCEVTDAAIKKVLQTGIVDRVLHWAKAKEDIDMKKKMKATGRALRIVGVPKLEDANWAGGKGSEECTLILTEGDSAKALAVAGLSIVGRDRFGVFPLRGKPLNVREANFQQTMNNQEIQNIIKIMGLDQKRTYEDVKSLRYGSIMIMADQDYDGSHIKGLLINMFSHWWPSLIKMNGFLKEFITPIVKATKGTQEVQFFTVHDYEKWAKENRDGKGWTIKYYKGLGTSTAKEGKEYFKNIEQHRMTFRWSSDKDDEVVDLAFNKKRADDRKDWINAYVEGDCVDHSRPSVSYTDFVNKELVCFSKYDVMRSIPSVVDGFKPTQRKVMFGCFKRNLKSDVKVAQLAGYIAEHSAYHHGEASLQGTIVGMAQDFVGSNNINLLVPSGQFGTRLQGGKDAASARYIYTRLERIARVIFHPDDDPILEQQLEEGQSIEPVWYIPVIPMVLVNGAEGIGTGWATSCPNYNPRDIIEMLRNIIKKKPVSANALCPWYKGFKGSIMLTDSTDRNGYEVVGSASRTAPNSIEITELPIKKWTQDYKEFLAKLAEGGEEGSRGRIDDFKEYHTENTVHFILTGVVDQMKTLENDGLEKALKLRSTMSTNNLVFFDAEGKIKKYTSETEILLEFAALRLKYYQKRKDFHVDRLGREKELLDAKVKFILLVIRDELVVSKRKRVDLVADLKKRGFKTHAQIFNKSGTAADDDDEGGAVPSTLRIGMDARIVGLQGAPELNGQACTLKAFEPDKGRWQVQLRNGEQKSVKAQNLHPAGSGGDAGSAVAKKEAKGGYDYLLGMPIWSLTHERVEELKRQMQEKTQELDSLKSLSIESLWERDLDAVVAELDAIDEREEELRKEGQRLKDGKRARPRSGATGRGGRGRRGRGSARSKGAEDLDEKGPEDEDEQEDEEDEEEESRPPPGKKPKTEETPAELLARLRERQKQRAKMPPPSLEGAAAAGDASGKRKTPGE